MITPIKNISSTCRCKYQYQCALALLLMVSLNSCMKSTYRESVCALEVTIEYNFKEGVEAVDGMLTLVNLNTRNTYKTSVVGTPATHLEISRGFYRIQFEGIARSNGKLARVVAVVEEKAIMDGSATLILKPLSQWL